LYPHCKSLFFLVLFFQINKYPSRIPKISWCKVRKGKRAIYGVFYGRFSGSKNHTIKLRTAIVRYHLGTHIIRLESRPSGQFNHKFSLGGAEKRTTVRFLRALSRGCYPRALREMLPCDAKDAVRRHRHRRCVSSPLLECRPRDKTHSPPRSLARKLLHTKRKELALC